MSDDNPLIEALDVAQALMDQILDDMGDIVGKKEVIAIGTGLATAGMLRYFLLHPELISKGLEQIGEALEIGGATAQQGMMSVDQLLPILAGALGVATVTPGVPPPP